MIHDGDLEAILQNKRDVHDEIRAYNEEVDMVEHFIDSFYTDDDDEWFENMFYNKFNMTYSQYCKKGLKRY